MTDTMTASAGSASSSAVLSGVGIGRGTAIGPVHRVLTAREVPLEEVVTGDVQAAVREAFAQVSADLRTLADGAPGASGDILAATAEMARDEMLLTEALRRVAAGTPSARAVAEAVEGLCATFMDAGGYLAERTADLRSICARVVARLAGWPAPGVRALMRPSVLLADDLAPADTAGLDPRLVLAIVTERGGPTSHTAIIAGQLGIPCVVRTGDAGALADGTVVAVDAATGTVTVDPDDELRDRFAERARRLEGLLADTAPGATSDGHPVALLANIGSVEEARSLGATGAEGVGLLRTELVYLSRATAPTVDDQVALYAAVLRSLGGAKVVIRTLDAGADKPLPFTSQAREANPALGVRGYRLVRRLPELLDDQLAALARAQRATGIAPWVMAPMISTATEAREFAHRARSAGLTCVGAMVEVPSAAWSIERLLRHLDFVSIGTNDLAQYTMGADRMCSDLTDLLDPWQPAVLGLVARTIAAANAAGKPVGVCGESAGDPAMALVLVGLGVSSLSMSPTSIPAVRFALRHHTEARCAQMAACAVAAGTADEARATVLAAMDDGVRTTLAVSLNRIG